MYFFFIYAQFMADDQISSLWRCPKGFINDSDSNSEPIYYLWSIKMRQHVNVRVLVEDRHPVKCRVLFAQDIDAIEVCCKYYFCMMGWLVPH